MSRLQQRIQKLEVLVSAESPEPQCEPIPEEWSQQLHDATMTVLATMRQDRAARAVELINSEDAAWLGDPIALRILDLALSACPPAEPRWFPMNLRGWICCRSTNSPAPLALPEAVCAFLDEHPHAVFDFYNCAQCGYRPGEDWIGQACSGHRTHAAKEKGKINLERCPLCGDEVGFCAYQARRHYMPPGNRVP